MDESQALMAPPTTWNGIGLDTRPTAVQETGACTSVPESEDWHKSGLKVEKQALLWIVIICVHLKRYFNG